jgi:hypothetical protein
MAQTVLITLTTAGADTGPFNIYENVDGYVTSIADNVSKEDLEAGYLIITIQDATTTIRVQSASPMCTNYVDLPIDGTPATTTTTTTAAPTTTTTTTVAPTTTTTTTLDQTLVHIENNISSGAGVQFTSLSISGGKTFTVTSGSWPLDQGESLDGYINGQDTYDLTLGINVGIPGSPDKVTVLDSTGAPTCENVSAGGAYAFLNQVCNNGTTVFITGGNGAC